MAHFTGTIEEFNKFIGGYTRNKVQYFTKNYKKDIGKCEHCGSRTKNLQAAHKKGKERPEIIFNILQNYIEDRIINVDLNSFEEQYILTHDPIDETIIVLCRNCHREYDRKSTELNPKLTQDKQIEILMENVKLTKKAAIGMLVEKGYILLNNDNAVFSNINKTKDVYWLEPNNEKFNDLLFIILNDSVNKRLHLFEIDKGQIVNPNELFEQRSDRNSSKLIVQHSDTVFKDKSGYNLMRHLKDTICYNI